MAGLRTHLECVEILLDIIKERGDAVAFARILKDENLKGAFCSGVIFPDWGFRGVHPDASEECHWKKFTETLANHILNEDFVISHTGFERADKMLYISFMLGVILHNYVDEPWHFDTFNNKSFLKTAFERDSASHGACEKSCDIFLFADKGKVNWKHWYPELLILEVYRDLNYIVSAKQLKIGFRKMLIELSRYSFWSPLMNTILKNKYKWTHMNFISHEQAIKVNTLKALEIMENQYARLQK